MFPAEKVAALDHALHEYGTTRPLTAEENAKLARYRTIQATHKTVAHPEQAVLYDAFHPRQVWRDTSGNPPGPWRRCAVGERILVLVR